MNLATPHPYQANSIDIAALVSALDGLAVGEVISYETLSAAIGRDITTRRYLLDRARTQLLKSRKVFGCVTRQGLQRLSDTEIVDTSVHQFKRIRRAARKGARVLSSVSDFNALNSEDKARHNLAISVLGVIAHAATPGNLSKLHGSCSNSKPHHLPIGHTLQLLAR